MKIEYELISREDVDEKTSLVFAELLRKQGKVGQDTANKINRCRMICVARVDGKIVAIGAIKKKTNSDFGSQKSGLVDLADKFEWELGYMYTEANYCGRGIGSNIARLLLSKYGDGNLMASTEISANPGMVKMLERLGFRLFGKPWKSENHGNYLALFLKFK